EPMDECDYAAILINKEVIKDKNILLSNLGQEIQQVFNHDNLVFLTDIPSLELYLEEFKSLGTNSLFMILPDHNSMDIVSLADKFLKNYSLFCKRQSVQRLFITFEGKEDYSNNLGSQ